jgi:alpha-tubulin suppressor-like RCC1 family protein
MKRFLAVTTAALIAVSSGCTDSPTGLVASGGPDQAIQEGKGRAWHGYDAPLVSFDGQQSPLEICAEWGDDRLLTHEDGRFAATDFFSFEFFLADGPGKPLSLGSARNKEGTRGGCFVVGTFEEGSYTFQVVGMARHGRGGSTSTHHSDPWSGLITIGEMENARYTVEISPSLTSIGVGGKAQFSATVRNAASELILDPDLEWASDDVLVATVDADGLASGLARGLAKVSVEFEGIRADATLGVRALPAVEISTPAADAEFVVESSIGFSGSATDSENGAIIGVALVWTSDLDGQIGTGTSFNSSSLSAGSHTISLTATDGEGLKGKAAVSILVAPSTAVMVSVSAGGEHSCGLTSAGVAYCWGNNDLGRLGDGTTLARTSAVAVVGGHKFKAISAGYRHTVGLTTSGKLYTWGGNGDGQLGDGTTTSRSTPTLVSEEMTFSMVSAGFLHTVALTTAGAAYAWGYNSDGQVGDNTSTERLVPTAVNGGHTFKQVSAGGSHTVAITTLGKAYGWGMNDRGQLGDGTTSTRRVPTPVWGDYEFAMIDAGSTHTVAVTIDGVGYGWGTSIYGELGNGSNADQRYATPISGGHIFKTISAGRSHSVGLTTAGKAYAFGYGSFGQLGDGSTNGVTLEPVPVSGSLIFNVISAGDHHTLGVSTAGAAFGWGRNTYRQLGDGTSENRLVPVAVSVP